MKIFDFHIIVLYFYAQKPGCMKIVSSLLATIFLLLIGNNLRAQDNPLMQMAGKAYAEYSPDLLFQFSTLIPADTAGCRKMILQAEEVAGKTGSMEWKLLSDYLELLLFERNMILYSAELYPIGELHRLVLELLDKAQKTKTLSIELLVRWKMIDLLFSKMENYESAFQECAIQDKKLQTVTSEAIPNKAHLYVQIADNYLFFKDYPTAIFYYKKILEETETIHTQLPQQNARNGLGLCYTEINQLDTAELFFQAMKQVSYLNAKNEHYRDIFDAIADGNTGAVMLLRNDYDKAIPLFENSLDKALKFYDHPFAACRAVDLANIYLRKENLPEAKRYIDLAISNRNLTKTPRNNDVFYEVLSKYYAATGDQKQSIAFTDLMLNEKKQSETKFNALVLLRMEQKEAVIRQQTLEQEIIKRQQSQRLLIIFGIGLIVIGALSGYVFTLYRRKSSAYHELVRKSQEWAQVTTATDESALMQQHTDNIAYDNGKKPDKQPDETDYLLMKEIEKLMTDEKLYMDTSLSIDLLAYKLGTKYHLVSNAINYCTNMSFHTFINEYRIKEAIRMLSNKDFNMLSVDRIADKAGFNDRYNFYRVFKKITGLSPTEFRKNLIG
jgi:AraC-like DNA-binding protein